MPVRKVSNRGGNIIGSFPPQIKGEKVRYESTIERNLVYFFKFDPTVITQEWAVNNNHDFAIVTDTNLHSGHTLENLKILWRYSRQTIPTATLARCIDYMKKHLEGVSFQDLALYLSTLATQELQQPFMQAPLIYNMLFRHILRTELTVPITRETLLWRSLAPTAAPLTYIRPLSKL